MFELELSIEKRIKKIRAAGFSVIPAIIAFGFSYSHCLLIYNTVIYRLPNSASQMPLVASEFHWREQWTWRTARRLGLTITFAQYYPVAP